MKSSAKTVDQYLEELPPERRETIARVRESILRSLPEGYQERMNWGMISYEIPLERYPTTYNRQPLSYVALAAQKSYNGLYLMTVYAHQDRAERLRRAFREAGLKLDMGKACVRFRSVEDLPLDVIEALIAETSPDQYIAEYEASRK